MSYACAALYFINLRGDVLLERRFRDDVDRDLAEHFRTLILNSKDQVIQTPVRSFGSSNYIYLRHNDIYILSLTRNNSNVMMALKFMTSLVDLFRSYIQGPLTENSVKNNFVLLYELVDEAMDFGYPQLTEPSMLKSFIFQKGVRTEVDQAKEAELARNATLTVTGAVGWRREGIKYKKNEVFLDIIEQVNLLMSSQGSVLRSDVAGKVVLKCFLSDMPELRLGLNDKLEDVTFHQCVNLGQWESQKVVTFIPPDGEFELMRYRCQDGINLPFKVIPVVNELGRTRVECNVAVKATFSLKMHATNVVILVPVPDYTAKASIEVSVGKAKYDATKKALVWKIRKFVGEMEHTLRADVTLVSTTKERKPWARPPVSMQFQVPMFSASGLRVAYLKILERKQGNNYQVEKWVRKLCKSGDYLIRS